MNIEEARDKLIDLVYGELAEPQRRELLEFVSASPALGAELERLRQARAHLAAARLDEPRQGPVLNIAAGSGRQTIVIGAAEGRTHRARRWAGIFGALTTAAAAAVVAVVLWWNPTTTTPVTAGPVEIKKEEVSVTILSVPEGSNVGVVAQAQTEDDVNVPGQIALANNPNSYSGPNPFLRRDGRWAGLAAVRDARTVDNLPKGASEVNFADVPSGIVPGSVRLRSANHPEGLTILEQNYQYDLASAGAILKRYVDKPITVNLKDGTADTGDLLSFDEQTLVVRPKGAGPVSIAREQVKAVTFSELPSGLRTRPTLVWELSNDQAVQHRLEVAYLTAGLTWRADYVLNLHVGGADRQASGAVEAAESKQLALAPGGGFGGKAAESLRKADEAAAPKAPAAPGTAMASGAPAAERDNGKDVVPPIVDTAELVGWASIANHSGTTYDQAKLKLLAGDVNLIQERAAEEMDRMNKEKEGRLDDQAKKAFEEKSFFEYHLYTLGRPTTLRNAETKQIELVSGHGIRLRRGYIYDHNVNPTAAQVVSEFKNSEDNGLGKPLPKGIVRLYAPDPSGEQSYVAQTAIDHTPKDEKVRLPWGFAFDIVCAAKQTAQKVDSAAGHEEWSYEIRNHKEYGVTVTVIVHVPATTSKAQCTLPGGGAYPWRVRQTGWVEIEVPVKADSSATVEFTYDYNNQSGGGLASPYDKKNENKDEGVNP